MEDSSQEGNQKQVSILLGCWLLQRPSQPGPPQVVPGALPGAIAVRANYAGGGIGFFFAANRHRFIKAAE